MKHQSKIWKNMLLGFAATACIGSLTACNQTENETANLSNEEVAIVIEGALANGTQGISAEVNDVIALSQQYAQKSLTNEYCGQSFDSTVVRSINKPSVTASYTKTWEWTLNCNNLRVPTSFGFNATSTGDYETTRMTSDDNASTDWTISNLISGSAYTINGSYTREGSQTSTVRNRSNSFTSEVNINITSLNVNKSTFLIDSGTATFTLTGSSTNGQNFSYQGSIVFNGNGTATITINGETFEVSLN